MNNLNKATDKLNMTAKTDEKWLHESSKRAKTENSAVESTDVFSFTPKLKQVHTITLSQVTAERDALVLERDELQVKIQAIQIITKDLLRKQMKDVMSVKDQMDLMASEFTFQFNELARSVERVCVIIFLYKLYCLLAQPSHCRRTQSFHCFTQSLRQGKAKFTSKI